MISLDFLDDFDERLAHLHGRRSGFRSKDFVVPSQKRNAILVNEVDGSADLAILLKKELLDRYQNFDIKKDFKLEHFPDLSVLIEELSHFKTYCDNAERNLEVSPLSLEVQAEVDKFSFALDCLEEVNYKALRHKVFETQFETLILGDWVKESEKDLYHQAHSLAKKYCLGLMKSCSSLKSLLSSVREFSVRPFQDKTRHSV